MNVRKVAAGGACIALLGAGAVVAATGEGTPPVVSPNGDAPRTSEVPPILAEQFRVFREPATGVPDDVAALFPGGGQTGRNPDLARPIKTLTGTGYVMPAANGLVCIAAPVWSPKGVGAGDWGVGCNAVSRASTRGIDLGFQTEAGESIHTVLLPDARAAEIVTASGDRRAVDAQDGVVSVRLNPGESVRVSDGEAR